MPVKVLQFPAINELTTYFFIINLTQVKFFVGNFFRKLSLNFSLTRLFQSLSRDTVTDVSNEGK